MIRITTRSLDRMVADWQQAGLIDTRTGQAILGHEETRGLRGQMPSTLVLLGGLAVALGLAALVSANWDLIPVTVKLGGHLLLTAAIAVAAWMRLDRAGSLAREVLLILLSASTLALIGHVGQSFNLQGSVAGLLGTWLLLVTPFTLAFARSGFHRWLWTIGAVLAVGFWLDDHGDFLSDRHLLTTAAVIPGLLFFAAPLAARAGVLDRDWGTHLRIVAVIALVAAASAGQLGWYLDGGETDLRDGALDMLVGAMVATAGLAVVTAVEPRGDRRGGLAALILLSPAYAVLPVLVAAFLWGAESMGLAAIGFCLYWLIIARTALTQNATGLFRLAVVLVALRIFIVFLEAAGGLLATGAGLVAAGLLLIAVGYGTRAAIRWAEERPDGDGPPTTGRGG